MVDHVEHVHPRFPHHHAARLRPRLRPLSARTAVATSATGSTGRPVRRPAAPRLHLPDGPDVSMDPRGTTPRHHLGRQLRAHVHPREGHRRHQRRCLDGPRRPLPHRRAAFLDRRDRTGRPAERPSPPSGARGPGPRRGRVRRRVRPVLQRADPPRRFDRLAAALHLSRPRPRLRGPPEAGIGRRRAVSARSSWPSAARSSCCRAVRAGSWTASGSRSRSARRSATRCTSPWPTASRATLTRSPSARSCAQGPRRRSPSVRRSPGACTLRAWRTPPS